MIMTILVYLQVLAEYRPDRFSWLLRHYDEIFTSLDFLLQNYHLRKYCKWLLMLIRISDYYDCHTIDLNRMDLVIFTILAEGITEYGITENNNFGINFMSMNLNLHCVHWYFGLQLYGFTFAMYTILLVSLPIWSIWKVFL